MVTSFAGARNKPIQIDTLPPRPQTGSDAGTGHLSVSRDERQLRRKQRRPRSGPAHHLGRLPAPLGPQRIPQPPRRQTWPRAASSRQRARRGLAHLRPGA